MSLSSFLLNKNPDGTPSDDPVLAPAFSLTKVMSAASVVIAPIGAVVVKLLRGDDFELTPGDVVALTLGLLGFLAVVAAADVIARAMAGLSGAALDDDVTPRSVGGLNSSWAVTAEVSATC